MNHLSTRITLRNNSLGCGNFPLRLPGLGRGLVLTHVLILHVLAGPRMDLENEMKECFDK